MYVHTDHWLSQCKRCLISKGDYTEPKTQQGSLVAQQPLELLCIDLQRLMLQREVRRTYLFSLMPSQNTVKLLLLPTKKPLQLPKILVVKWFSVFGIPARIHSDQGRSFDNEIISHLCKMYGFKQSTTTPYNPHGNAQCEWFNHTLFGLM